MNRIKLLLVLISYMSLATHSAWSATSGTLGATSTGSIVINLTVPARAQISRLTDVTFTNADPSTAVSNAQNICVYSNTATKGYTLTATGSGTANAFTLASGALAVIPYSVQFAATSGQTSGTAVVSGTALTGLTSTATTPTCSSGPSTTASLIVNIAATDLQTAQAGAAYAGTLTLVITPV